MMDTCMGCELFYIHNGLPVCEAGLMDSVKEGEDCEYYDPGKHKESSAEAYLRDRTKFCPEEENTWNQP